MTETIYTKERILEELKKILEELFEIDPNTVTLETRLGEDLDLDSIDAVDMLVHVQNFLGERIQPEDFRQVRTVGDVVNVLYDVAQKAQAK